MNDNITKIDLTLVYIQLSWLPISTFWTYFHHCKTILTRFTTITDEIFARRFISKIYEELIKHNATIITFRTIWQNARLLHFEQANWLVISVRWTPKIFIELRKEFIYCILQLKKRTSLLCIWIRKKKRLNILCVLFLDLYENALNWWVWITVAWKIFTKTLVMSSSFFQRVCRN